MTGQTISHYRIQEKIGGGGMGVVYRAEDTKLGRGVALKFLPEGMHADPAAVERFQREARAASALNHPNICTIYEVDEKDDRPFIAMELLEGETVKHRSSTGPLRLDDVSGIWHPDRRCAGRRAHPRHRPSRHQARQSFHHSAQPDKNPRFRTRQASSQHDPPRQRAVLGRSMATAADLLTSPGSTLGTIAYMSPEQARGEPLDARTDLFSFGVVLYEMTTGKMAFDGSTSALIFDAILHKEARSIHQINPELPNELERIISKALEKDRDMRYQAAAEMRTDLKRLKRDLDSAAGVGQRNPPPPPPRKTAVPSFTRKQKNLSPSYTSKTSAAPRKTNTSAMA